MHRWRSGRSITRAAVALFLLDAAIVAAQAPEEGPLDDIDDGMPLDEPAPAQDPFGEAPADAQPSGGTEAQAGFEAQGSAGANGDLSHAVSAESTQPAPAASGGKEIVVTGSRIKRTSFATPSAVQVIGRKELEKSGASNMADVVRVMSINAGSEVNADVSTGAAGTAQFNLRGLGLSSTLVLLNGRRLPTSGATATDGSNFVDINTIPIGVIERIEVLKGGASAIYGSDAVAGVVNIITRKRFDGFEAQVGGQTTDDFDHHEWDVALLGGASGDRTRVTGAVSYFKREPLDAEDRAFTNNNRNISNLGWPSTFLRIPPTPVMEPDQAMGAMRFDTYLDPACGMAPLSAPSMDPYRRLNFCTFDFNPYFMLMVEEQRVNVLSTIEHDLSDHTMAFAEALYARSRAYRTTSPSYPILSSVIIPPDHRYNPTGQSLRWYGRVAGGGSPPTDNNFDSDTLHTVVGIGGDFGGFDASAEDWEWELAGTWSGNRWQVFTADVLTEELVDAVNSCTAADDPAGCWNPFSTGAPNSQDLYEEINGEVRGLTDTELTTLNADLTGPLFALPGGDLSLAIGGQMRQESARVNPDHDANRENYIFLIGGPDWRAERSVLAGYGELMMPFFRGFELQGAGRVEHYDDVGSHVDPMFGVSWTPATTFVGEEASAPSKVRLRGTFAQSFRAPSLLHTRGALTELAETYDVNNVPDMAGNPVPVQSTTPTYRAVRTFGNPDLGPQSANAITAGLEWGPVKGLVVEGDYWRYDYQDIIVKENAQQILARDFLNQSDPRVLRDPATGLAQQINVMFVNAEEVVTHGIDLGVNYLIELDGADHTLALGARGSYILSYEIPQSSVGPGLWNESFVACSAPGANPAFDPPAGSTCDVAGSRNSQSFARSLPRLRGTVPVGWSLGGHNATLNVNFIGGYQDDGDSNPLPGQPAEEYRAIDAQATFDLQYAFRLEETEYFATTFKVGVINLLDSDPPAVNAGYGYDVTTHDPRGRLLYGRLIQEF